MGVREKSMMCNGCIILVFLIIVGAVVSSYIYYLPEEGIGSAFLKVCYNYQGETLPCESQGETEHYEAECSEIDIPPPTTTVITLTTNYQRQNPEISQALKDRGVQDGQTVTVDMITVCRDGYVVTQLDAAPTFAYVVLALVGVGMAVMVRFSLYSKGRQRSLQSYYSCSAFLVLSLIALTGWILWNHPVPDAIPIIRIVALFICILYAIFICSCLFITNVTATYVTQYITHYVDTGRTTSTTVSEDFGFVYCRMWACFADSPSSNSISIAPAPEPVASISIEMPSIQTSSVAVIAPSPVVAETPQQAPASIQAPPAAFYEN